MKYKRGKGRLVRKQQKVFKLKSGGGKFSFSGGHRRSPFGNPVPVGESVNDRVRGILESIGWNVKGGDR